MQLQYNGKWIETPHTTLKEFLAENNITPETNGVAVAVNGIVVLKPQWEDFPISDNTVIEVVHPFQGG